MRYEFSYENNRGQIINLSKYPFYLNVEPIFDYQWAYSQKEKRRGNIIAGFAKDVKDVDLVLHILAKTIERRDEAIDDFNNLVEADIYDGIAGKIWCGDWYTRGYIVAAKNSKWQYGNPLVKKDIKLVREQENWWHVIRAANFGNDVTEQLESVSEEDIKTYERHEGNVEQSLQGYDYEYDYMRDVQNQKRITNPSSLPCDFVVNIQGYVDRPEIQIGQNVISVDVEVPYGAVLMIDSSNKTAIMRLANGELVNVFGARNPDYYLFEKIKSGKNIVSWNGGYLWEINMLEERSEPRWLMD